MTRPTVSVAVYLCLVFLSGLLVGGLGVSVYMKKSAASRPTLEQRQLRYLTEMRTRLKLSDDQVRQYKSILENTGKQLHALHDQIRPQEHAVMERQAESVRAILNEAQRVEYRKIREEREKRRQQPDRLP
ncbi:MAG: hypothetical protein ACLQGV_20640 [Bryobacteraceae bacterium]